MYFFIIHKITLHEGKFPCYSGSKNQREDEYNGTHWNNYNICIPIYTFNGVNEV